MNGNIAKQWISALRSGKYSQGFSKLKRIETKPSEYCCLGVLQECVLGFSIKADETYLSEKAMNKAGIKFHDGTWDARVPQSNLSTLNDGGASFKEIADVIEQKWKDL